MWKWSFAFVTSLVASMAFVIGFATSMVTHSPSINVTEFSPECGCDTMSDKYEVPQKIIAGESKGKCIDSCRYRSPKLAENSKSQIALANVLHEKIFWTARFDKNYAESAQVILENFAPLL